MYLNVHKPTGYGALSAKKSVWQHPLQKKQDWEERNREMNQDSKEKNIDWDKWTERVTGWQKPARRCEEQKGVRTWKTAGRDGF